MSKDLSRRDFLRHSSLAAAGAAFFCSVPGARSRSLHRSRILSTTIHSVQTGKWNTGATWNTGVVPTSSDVVGIGNTHVVTLNTSPTVAGVEIDAGGKLTFQGGNTRTLTSTGNVVVRGELEMRPGTGVASIPIHKIVFDGINESGFTGGGQEIDWPMASDVGLWVLDSGFLDLEGKHKKGWDRTGKDSSWAVSDEMKLAPYTGGDYTTFASFTKGDTMPAAVKTGFPKTEVLNLTRTVRIEGTSGGRSHIFIHSDAAQSLKYAAFRYMGPRKGGHVVLGRYPVHFHMCDGLGDPPGSIVTGCVVRDSGAHAYVPHESSNITFTDCISYSTQEDAFWWDHDTLSDDITYDSCGAFYVLTGDEQYQLSGFVLGPGTGGVIEGCVAAGVQGSVRSSGFKWPEKDTHDDIDQVWQFGQVTVNVAHNNVIDGIFAWQNDSKGHDVGAFTTYFNGKAGIEHGANLNSYVYSGPFKSFKDGYDGTGDHGEYGGCGIMVHAASTTDYPNPVTFNDYDIDGGSRTHFGILLSVPNSGWPNINATPDLATNGIVSNVLTADYDITDAARDAGAMLEDLLTVS